MSSDLREKRFLIWDAVSYAWTGIGLDNNEYNEYGKQLDAKFNSWEEIDLIIKRDVCASFALDSFLIFPCMLWMIMPDWGYNEEYLMARMDK